MGTPVCVKFSRIVGTPLSVYQRLISEFLEPLSFERPEFVRLYRTDDPMFAGFKAVNEPTLCQSTNHLLEQVTKGREFGSVHMISSIPGSIYFHVVDVDETGFTFTAEIDTGLVAWENENFARGQWFKMMLTTLVSALRADICGYGRAYDLGYDYLDSDKLLEFLRSGELMKTWYPTFHAVSTKLISSQEMFSLFENREKELATDDLRYETSSLGYHLLYILP